MKKIHRMIPCGVLTAAFLGASLLTTSALAETASEAREPAAQGVERETLSPRHPFEARQPEGRRGTRPEGSEDARSREGGPSIPQAERRGLGPIKGQEEMEMLDRLLAMSPEQLGRVRRALERIEAMSPEERAAMRSRLKELHEIPLEQREKMREAWRDMSPEERRQHIRELRERRQRVIEGADREAEQSERGGENPRK